MHQMKAPKKPKELSSMRMGGFKAKVGEKKEDYVVGPYGMGERNDNEEPPIDFCKEEDLVPANTWFEQR